MRFHLYTFKNKLPYATIPSFTIVASNRDDAYSNAYDKFRDALELDEYSISLKSFDFWNDDNEETDDWNFNPTKEEDCPYIGEDVYRRYDPIKDEYVEEVS